MHATINHLHFKTFLNKKTWDYTHTHDLRYVIRLPECVMGCCSLALEHLPEDSEIVRNVERISRVFHGEQEVHLLRKPLHRNYFKYIIGGTIL